MLRVVWNYVHNDDSAFSLTFLVSTCIAVACNVVMKAGIIARAPTATVINYCVYT